MILFENRKEADMDNNNEKRMNALQIGRRIKKARTESGLTQRDVAQKVKVNPSTIMRYEKGTIMDIKIPVVNAIALALDVNPSWLLGYDVPKRAKNTMSTESTSIRIPVLGSVPAGIPLEAIEDIEDWEEIPREWTKGDKDYFGLKIHGDSMYPKYMDGDTIILRKADDCESGDECVVYVNGYDATFKKVIKKMDHIILQPLNSEYEPIMIDNNDENNPVKIVGIVVELRRKL